METKSRLEVAEWRGEVELAGCKYKVEKKTRKANRTKVRRKVKRRTVRLSVGWLLGNIK